MFDSMTLLCDESKSFIISMNLNHGNIKNLIQLSNLELDGLCSLFSFKDLWDSNFQDTVIKFVSLGKSVFQLNQRKSWIIWRWSPSRTYDPNYIQWRDRFFKSL
jgi:hypothetical protein